MSTSSIRKFIIVLQCSIVTLSTVFNAPITSAQSIPTESTIRSSFTGSREEARQKSEFFSTKCISGSDSGSSENSELGKVFVMGDSITLRAKGEYERLMREAGASEVKVSATGSSNIEAGGPNGDKMSGLESVDSNSSYIKDADTIIIAYGTNNLSHGDSTAAPINKLMDKIKETGTSANIKWVDIAITDAAGANYSAYTASVNKMLYSTTSSGYSMIAWSKVVDPSYDAANATGTLKHNPELIDPDGIHQLPGVGSEKLVETVISETKSSGGSSSSSGGGGLAGETGTEGEFQTNGENKLKQILVHTTEGNTAESAISTLKARGYAYHVLIEENGNEIRLVEDKYSIGGARSANSKSLHVSLVGMARDGSHFDPKSPQLQTLSKRIGQWASKHNIPIKKIEGKEVLDSHDGPGGVAGHIDVANADPEEYGGNGRTDPGEKFPWVEVLKNARGGKETQDDVCCDDVSNNKAGSGVNGGGCGEQGYGNGKVSEENKNQIWSFLISNGLSEEAAAGIMGNIDQETGGTYMTDADNGATYGSQYGSSAAGVGCIGIVQWCHERIDGLVNFARERGKEWTCLGVQLEYMWYEMESTDEGRSYRGEVLSIPLQDALNGADIPNKSLYYPDGKPTPEGAARMFHNYFERSNEEAGEHLGRGGRAEKIYEEFTGKSASSLGGNPACENKSESNFGNGIVEAALEMGKWGEEYDACYLAGGGHADQVDLERRIDNHFNPINDGVDCSGFTSAAILKGTGELFIGSTQAYCDSDRFEKIPIDKAEPGDFSIDCGTHIEVITAVNGLRNIETMGSHTHGCGVGKGPSPGNYSGTENFVLRFKGGSGS